MTNKKQCLQQLAVATALTISTSAFALSPPPGCDSITNTNDKLIEMGLAKTCNYFSVCSTGDNKVIGYTWTSSSTETTLYTDGSGVGYKDEPEHCKVIDPNSCPSTEDTLASLQEKGLAENCNSFSICSTGDGKTLGYSWLANYSKAKVFIGGDQLGYSQDPANCALIEEADLAITAVSESTRLFDGQITTVNVNIDNIGTVDSTSAALIETHIALVDGCSMTDCAEGGEIIILGVDSNDVSCDADSYSISCLANPIAANTGIELAITVQATRLGPVAMDIRVSADDDANIQNNSTFVDFEIEEISEEVTYIEPAINIISSTELPNTENSAFTSDGSLYVAQAAFGGSIYRISRDSSGNYSSHSFIEGPENCRFTGMTSSGITLYAACQTNGNGTYLMKIELIDDMLDVVSKKLEFNHGLANGMGVGPDGSIYISDSDKVEASVIKVEITDPVNFEIKASKWLDKGATGSFVNGIQIEGNLMYLADRTKIQTIQITNQGPGEIKDFYTPSGNILIDDFAITPDHLAVAEIDYYVAMMGGKGATGHTIIIDKKDGNNVLQKIAAKNAYQPSSVVYDGKGIFSENGLFVTDYFLGGLYLIEADGVVYITE